MSRATTSGARGHLRLSVAMTTCDGARFLAPQLASLEKQIRPPDEVVISDDGSRDGTAALLDAFAARATFPVEVLRSRTRVGCIRNYEVAISRCTGEVVVLCDQDDVWLAHKLAAIEQEFLARPESVLAFSDAYLMDEWGRRTGTRLWEARQFRSAERRALERDPLPQLMHRSIVTGCTLAFRARYAPLLLPFPTDPAGPGIRVFHDRWMSMVLAAVGHVVPIAQPLMEYRLHRDQHVGIPRLRVRRLLSTQLMAWQQVLIPPQHLTNRIGTFVELLSTASARMEKELDEPQRGEALDQIARCVDHLSFRTAVRSHARQSRTPILPRVLNGEYGRFSGGLASAVSDVRAPAG